MCMYEKYKKTYLEIVNGHKRVRHFRYIAID